MYSLRVLCQCYSCTATILSDVNCKSEWVLHQGRHTHDNTPHLTASTPVECQKACEFDPRCVVVDWSSSRHYCDLNTKPNHTHYGNVYRDHYDLVSRCNIKPGQCFTTSKILKTILIPNSTRLFIMTSA